jgi:hypothetical protein
VGNTRNKLMSELATNFEPEPTHELWHLASEADRSMKAAFYSLRQDAKVSGVSTRELRRDVRRAAIDHGTLVGFLHSGAWHWPAVREGMTEAAVYSNIAASSGAFLLRSDEVRRMEQHLQFQDVGTQQEALFLDRYAAWLDAPREPNKTSFGHPENDADRVRWHIQALANFYAFQFEEPLR